MDKRMRGIIEKELDGTLKEVGILSSIRWVSEEIPISSLEDLALGYVIGSMDSYAIALHQVITRTPVGNMDEIQAILKRRLPEIMDKINRELHR